jgi:signal transduction histidine kinase
VQQHLAALAVNLQLAETLTDDDPAAAKALLEDLGRDVVAALQEAAELAQRIHPSLLEARGLAVALRSAAASAGVRASLELAAGASYPRDIVEAIYWCCLGAFEHAGAGAQATVTVREEEESVAFEVVEDASRSDAGLDRLRDRIEALGGSLAIRSEPGGGTRIAGSLPLSR